MASGSIATRIIGAAGKGWWLCLLALGCGIGVPGAASSSPGGDNPLCAAYCNARITKGCGGDVSLCKLACNVIYSSAQEGVCQQDYINIQNCEYDPAILDLGCAPPQDKIDAACTTQQTAYRDCTKRRDGT